MKAGLMTKEDLGNLGFGGVDNVVDDGQQAGHHVSEDQVDKEFLGKESILRELEQELQRRQDGLMS